MLTITILYIFDSVFFLYIFLFPNSLQIPFMSFLLEVNFGLKITSLNIFPFFFLFKILIRLAKCIDNKSVSLHFLPKKSFSINEYLILHYLVNLSFANQLQKFNTSTLNLLSASPIGENKFMSVEGISSWWNVLVLKHFLQDSSYRLHGYNQVSMI